MHEITAQNAADYLRESGQVADRAEIDVRELSGGVSNIVLRVDIPGRAAVRDQAMPRAVARGHGLARPARPDLDRTRHARCARLDPACGDRSRGLVRGPNEYLFAMTCAPDDAVTWKTQLMAGQIDPNIAARLGTILGTIHADAPRHPALRGHAGRHKPLRRAADRPVLSHCRACTSRYGRVH